LRKTILLKIISILEYASTFNFKSLMVVSWQCKTI